VQKAAQLRGFVLPIAPAQLALATIVQAYTGVSDVEAIEATKKAPWIICDPESFFLFWRQPRGIVATVLP
jgi:hypothetical protein